MQCRSRQLEQRWGDGFWDWGVSEEGDPGPRGGTDAISLSPSGPGNPMWGFSNLCQQLGSLGNLGQATQFQRLIPHGPSGPAVPALVTIELPGSEVLHVPVSGKATKWDSKIAPKEAYLPYISAQNFLLRVAPSFYWRRSGHPQGPWKSKKKRTCMSMHFPCSLRQNPE